MTDTDTPRIPRTDVDRSYPVTPQTRAAILELLAVEEPERLGRNEVARRLGIPGAYVSEVAKSIGHSWLGSPLSEAAREARMARIREARSRVEAKLWEEAERALDDMHSPTELVHFDPGTVDTEHALGREGAFVTKLIPEPTIADRRNLSVVAGVMIQRATDLAKATTESTESIGGGIVDEIGRGLERVGLLLQDQGVNPTEPPAERIDVEAMVAEVEADPHRAQGDDL